MNELHIFDMDETLFTYPTSPAKIYANLDPPLSLSGLEYIEHHNLNPDCVYDFSEFSDTDSFIKHAKPVWPMIDALVESPNSIILTARAKMNNMPLFYAFLRVFGIDCKVYMLGQTMGRGAGYKKARFIKEMILDNSYKAVHMYDDSGNNIDDFLELSEVFPHIEFNASHIHHQLDSMVINKISVKYDGADDT